MSAIGKVPVVEQNQLVAAGQLNPQDDGTVTLTINNVSGEVLSIQPDGSWELRPAGTSGPYEKASLNGNFLVYCPTGKNIFVYPFFKDCPNI